MAHYAILMIISHFPNGGDIKFAFAITGGGPQTVSQGLGFATDTSNTISEQKNFQFSVGIIFQTTDNEDATFEFWFNFESNATTGGDIEVQWAQSIASANTTTLRQNSNLEVTLLGDA